MNPYLIPDDPIVKSMERTGLPPWQLPRKPNSFGSGFEVPGEDFWEEGDDGSVFYGNETDSF